MADEDFVQSIHDALAVTTLLADAVESGADWSETRAFAAARLGEQGDRLVMAQAFLLHEALKSLREVLNGLPDDVDLEGVDRPVTVSALLRQFAESAARYEG
jgi:hypothetical protein